MGFERQMLRARVRRLYKEQSKGTPKKQRMTYAQFFENYTRKQDIQEPQVDTAVVEDFDLEQAVIVNNTATVVDEVEVDGVIEAVAQKVEIKEEL